MSGRLAFIVLLCCQVGWAFPPAPPAVIFGKVRGEFGFSPGDGTSRLLLLVNDEVVAKAVIADSEKIGENYRMTLPVDLNPVRGLYRIGAVTPQELTTYRFVVERNGQQLPISRVVRGEAMPDPGAGKLTRYDFVLGEDTDGDGLPDDWERFQAMALGPVTGDPLDYFSRNGDRDGDGLSDWDEYVAGTFALLFEDGLNFQVVKVYPDGSADLSFLAIEEKTYAIESSSDLKTWTPVVFTVGDNVAEERTVLQAASTQYLNVTAEPTANARKVVYRLKVD